MALVAFILREELVAFILRVVVLCVAVLVSPAAFPDDLEKERAFTFSRVDVSALILEVAEVRDVSLLVTAVLDAAFLSEFLLLSAIRVLISCEPVSFLSQEVLSFLFGTNTSEYLTPP